jgi:hypothetical protein
MVRGSEFKPQYGKTQTNPGSGLPACFLVFLVIRGPRGTGDGNPSVRRVLKTLLEISDSAVSAHLGAQGSASSITEFFQLVFVKQLCQFTLLQLYFGVCPPILVTPES